MNKCVRLPGARAGPRDASSHCRERAVWKFPQACLCVSDHPAVTRRGPGGLALPPRLSRSLCLHPHTYPGSATADSVSQVRGLCPPRSGTVRQTLLPSPLSTRPGLFSPQMQVQKVFDLKEAESSGPRGMLWPCGLPAGRMTSVSGWGLGKDPSSPGRSTLSQQQAPSVP